MEPTVKIWHFTYSWCWSPSSLPEGGGKSHGRYTAVMKCNYSSRCNRYKCEDIWIIHPGTSWRTPGFGTPLGHMFILQTVKSSAVARSTSVSGEMQPVGHVWGFKSHNEASMLRWRRLQVPSCVLNKKNIMTSSPHVPALLNIMSDHRV